MISRAAFHATTISPSLREHTNALHCFDEKPEESETAMTRDHFPKERIKRIATRV